MRRTFVLLMALLLSGCRSAPDNESSRIVRDSSGIRIVSMPDIELPQWRVDTVPIVDIGTVEGTDGQDLAAPWASRRLSDGRILVSNAQTNELRMYRSDGTFNKTVGRSGEGPGEFGLVAAIHVLSGDTLVVADARLPRLNLFDRDGVFLRTVTLDPLEDRLPRLRGFVRDSMAVYRVAFRQGTGGVTRAVRDTFLVASRAGDGEGPYIPIGRFPANQTFYQATDGGFASWPLPFGRNLFTAFADQLLWIGVSDVYELRGYEARTGALRRILRLERDPLPVRGDERDRFVEYQLAMLDGEEFRRQYRRVAQMIEFPPTMPAFADVINDAENNLWVQDYQVPWDDSGTSWRVYAAGGDGVATVQLPGGMMRIHDIGADYIMGWWKDDLDVDHIRVYRLRKDTQ